MDSTSGLPSAAPLSPSLSTALPSHHLCQLATSFLYLSLFLTDTEATSGEGASQSSEYFSHLPGGWGPSTGPGKELFLPPGTGLSSL